MGRCGTAAKCGGEKADCGAKGKTRAVIPPRVFEFLYMGARLYEKGCARGLLNVVAGLPLLVALFGADLATTTGLGHGVILVSGFSRAR